MMSEMQKSLSKVVLTNFGMIRTLLMVTSVMKLKTNKQTFIVRWLKTIELVKKKFN